MRVKDFSKETQAFLAQFGFCEKEFDLKADFERWLKETHSMTTDELLSWRDQAIELVEPVVEERRVNLSWGDLNKAQYTQWEVNRQSNLIG